MSAEGTGDGEGGNPTNQMTEPLANSLGTADLVLARHGNKGEDAFGFKCHDSYYDDCTIPYSDIFLSSNFRYLKIRHLHRSRFSLALFAAKGDKQAAPGTSISPSPLSLEMAVYSSSPVHLGLFLC